MNSPSANPLSTGRIPSLDGLRGIAILMVMLGHALPSLPPVAAPVLKFAGNGALGVNVFFVLSGFLIYSLSVGEIEKSGRFNWRYFYLRRILRIFPCFYFYIAVILVLVHFRVLVFQPTIVASAATFSLNYRHTAWFGDYFVIGHYWTLALEEQFYLTWPILVFLFLRRQLLVVLTVVVLSAPFIRLASYFLCPGWRGQITMMFHTGFDAIAAGVLLGEVLRLPRAKAWLLRLVSSRVLVIGVILFLLVISPTLVDRFKGAYFITVGKSLDLLGICLLVVAAVFRPETLMFRVLNWPVLTFIGVLSYSLYVWNNFFLYDRPDWPFRAFPLNFVGVFAMACVSHYLIENPFLRLKRHFLRPRSVSNLPGTVTT